MTVSQPAEAALDRLYRSLGTELLRVDAEISDAMKADRPEVSAMTSHVARYSGKKLRPALVLLIARSLGGPSPRHYRLGAIVELIHLATLVHDDVIDEAGMRRRDSTVNARWSNFDAVLLGDVIFARAINLLARLGDFRCLELLTKAVSTLCEGEILQNRHRQSTDVDEALYYRIIQDKTAALYSAGCELAAHIAGASPDVASACGLYGMELGTAFQITDDCLDLIGDEAVVGKSLGTDLRNGKMTLPILMLLANATGAERERAMRVISGGATEADDLAFMRRTLTRTGSIEAALTRARQHATKAVTAVRRSLPAGSITEFEAIADFVLARRR